MRVVLIIGMIGVYSFLYTQEKVLKNKGDAQIQWIEGTRGWSEDGTYLWTGVSPLPSYNVGIGTNTPQYKLDVLGSGRFQGDIYINLWPIKVTSQPQEGYVLKWVSAQGAFIPRPDSGGIGGSGTATQVAFWTSATTIGGNSNLWWDNTNLRLGIGTSSPTHNLHVTGSTRIDGDFYNQEVGAAQTSVQLGNYTVLQTVTITTHGPGSAVLLTATAAGAADYAGWYSISIHRDGTGTANELCEVSQGVDAGYDVELSLTWIDNPPEGTHTYYLIFGTNGGIGYWYSYSLQVVEIKR